MLYTVCGLASVCDLQVSTEALKARLSLLQCTRRPYRVELVQPDSQHSDALRDQVALAQVLASVEVYVESAPRTKQHPTLVLGTWAMKEAALEQLQHLPSWSGELCMRTCTWPLEPAAYASLAAHIPPTFKKWVLGDMSQAVFKSICEGVAAKREGQGLRPLEVTWRGHEGGVAKLGKHVVCKQW